MLPLAYLFYSEWKSQLILALAGIMLIDVYISPAVHEQGYIPDYRDLCLTLQNNATLLS